jgi:Cu(I)/Ag(I) efflux system periplasmic protein CusF
MRFLIAAALLLALAAPPPALAGDAHNKDAPTSAKLADGEVRKVDKDARKLTIRHGPLPQLDMPTPMTMVYQVKDPALLEQVKAGDRIRFEAEKIGGQFTVTRIEQAK